MDGSHPGDTWKSSDVGTISCGSEAFLLKVIVLRKKHVAL